MTDNDRGAGGRFVRNRMASPPIDPPRAQSRAVGPLFFLAVIIVIAGAAGWWFGGP